MVRGRAPLAILGHLLLLLLFRVPAGAGEAGSPPPDAPGGAGDAPDDTTALVLHDPILDRLGMSVEQTAAAAVIHRECTGKSLKLREPADGPAAGRPPAAPGPVKRDDAWSAHAAIAAEREARTAALLTAEQKLRREAGLGIMADCRARVLALYAERQKAIQAVRGDRQKLRAAMTGLREEHIKLLAGRDGELDDQVGRIPAVSPAGPRARSALEHSGL
jgi:hypothetical protein